MSESYDYDKTYCHPDNQPVVSRHLSMVECPSNPNGTKLLAGSDYFEAAEMAINPNASAYTTDFEGNCGFKAAAPVVEEADGTHNIGFFKRAYPPHQRSVREISDGTSHTVAAWESAGRDKVYWRREIWDRKRSLRPAGRLGRNSRLLVVSDTTTTETPAVASS